MSSTRAYLAVAAVLVACAPTQTAGSRAAHLEAPSNRATLDRLRAELLPPRGAWELRENRSSPSAPQFSFALFGRLCDRSAGGCLDACGFLVAPAGWAPLGRAALTWTGHGGFRLDALVLRGDPTREVAHLTGGDGSILLLVRDDGGRLHTEAPRCSKAKLIETVCGPVVRCGYEVGRVARELPPRETACTKAVEEARRAIEEARIDAEVLEGLQPGRRYRIADVDPAVMKAETEALERAPAPARFRVMPTFAAVPTPLTTLDCPRPSAAEIARARAALRTMHRERYAAWMRGMHWSDRKTQESSSLPVDQQAQARAVMGRFDAGADVGPVVGCATADRRFLVSSDLSLPSKPVDYADHVLAVADGRSGAIAPAVWFDRFHMLGSMSVVDVTGDGIPDAVFSTSAWEGQARPGEATANWWVITPSSPQRFNLATRGTDSLHGLDRPLEVMAIASSGGPALLVDGDVRVWQGGAFRAKTTGFGDVKAEIERSRVIAQNAVAARATLDMPARALRCGSHEHAAFTATFVARLRAAGIRAEKARELAPRLCEER